MTRILVRTLADARDTIRVLDATITATATRARVDGDTITLPEPVAVRLRRGELSSPLELEAPDGTWAWQFLVQPTGTRRMDALSFLRTFPDVAEIEWGDMTPVDPATLTPLDPVPPSAAQVLLRAKEAVTAAEGAVEDATGALSVANTAVVAGTVTGDDLILTRKDGGTINAGNVRGLAGSIVPWGTSLGSLDLDTVTAPGMYRQDNNNQATVERHYPLAGTQGILEVLTDPSASNLMQRWTSLANAGALQGHYIRRRTAVAWGAWVFFAKQRVDKAAGLAIYTWDDQAQREQLVYADSGLRTINTELAATAGNVYIRRRSYEVTVSFVNTVLPAINVYLDLPALPSGWRAQVNSNTVVLVNGIPQRLVAISNGIMRVYGQSATPVTVDGTITFTTNNGWPALIGAANGGIPNL